MGSSSTHQTHNFTFLRQPNDETAATLLSYSAQEAEFATKEPPYKKKLALLPLIFLIYFEVSGGPYGEEPAVQAAGPLFAIAGFLIFPIIWSIPEALITAELSTAYPGNGGYVIWATEAFGPFWGFLMGWWKYVSGVINNAAFPILCIDYAKIIFPSLASGTYKYVAISAFNLFLSFLNYMGLTIVGWVAFALAVTSLLPFVLMFLFAIPKIKPGRWLSQGNADKDWKLYLNTLFWNLNFWDNASTLAGEVEKPQTTYPKALIFAGLLVCISYLIPLLAGTGALELNQSSWTNGYLADIAGVIAGKWLKYWVEVGAVLSTIGLFEAQLSSSSFQLLGMAELGHLPNFFLTRSKLFNTPSYGVLVSTVLTFGLSFMSFDDVVSAANCLYSCGMLLEFGSYIWLRKKYPLLERPYKVPLGIRGLVCMLILPTAFIFTVMALDGKVVYLISLGLTVLGLVVYGLMRVCKDRNWLTFVKVNVDDGDNEFES